METLSIKMQFLSVQGCPNKSWTRYKNNYCRSFQFSGILYLLVMDVHGKFQENILKYSIIYAQYKTIRSGEPG